jgi:hypothetical protein
MQNVRFLPLETEGREQWCIVTDVRSDRAASLALPSCGWPVLPIDPQTLCPAIGTSRVDATTDRDFGCGVGVSC